MINSKHFFCINHKEKKIPLSLDCYITDPENKNECVEGVLICPECNGQYPIIDGVAIIVPNLESYCANRITMLGQWFIQIKSDKLKEFIKNISLSIESKTCNDRYETDGLYFQSYKWLHNENFESDKFLHLMRWKIKPSDVYRKLTSSIMFNPEGMALDLGCSLGLATFELSKKFSFVFGIDKSFSFIREARKKQIDQNISNTEFFVGDIVQLPFRSQKFDLIFGLNIIEFVSIENLLKLVHNLLKPHSNFIITSPYDYNREMVFDQEIDDKVIRNILKKNGFEISQRTEKESFIPWILKINERTYLFYFLDYIEAKKISKQKY